MLAPPMQFRYRKTPETATWAAGADLNAWSFASAFLTAFPGHVPVGKIAVFPEYPAWLPCVCISSGVELTSMKEGLPEPEVGTGGLAPAGAGEAPGLQLISNKRTLNFTSPSD